MSFQGSTKPSSAHCVYCIQIQTFVPAFAKGGIFCMATVTNGTEQFKYLHFWRKFQDLLISKQFVINQECCNQNFAVLMGHIFTKRCWVIKIWPASTPTANISWKTPMKTSLHQNLMFFIFTDVANLCFSQSPLRVTASRSCSFPVLMAAIC